MRRNVRRLAREVHGGNKPTVVSDVSHYRNGSETTALTCNGTEDPASPPSIDVTAISTSDPTANSLERDPEAGAVAGGER